MNPECAKCSKAVYPMEKLDCLDKCWHKLCFNCEVCNLNLNMENYKGYNKLPYCNTHYPTTKHTTVAETPENLRLKEQTTNQSNVVYHKDFEAEKGHFTAVADDPEMLRMKKTQAQASDIKYANSVNELGRPPPEVAARPANRPRLAHGAPPPEAPPQAAPEPPPMANSGAGNKFVAVYDYSAADEDEVSFQEGDIIIDATVIDDGWMEGRVERTGGYGMFPSNYVEAQ